MDNPGYQIRRLRKVADLTQEQLAARCGVTSQTISNIENEKTPVAPRLATLRKIAEGLGVDVSRLFDDSAAA